MAINLKDIPDAVAAYLDSKVTVAITPITPASGTSLNPNEEFTFSVTTTNATAANGGIPLKNLRYKIWLENSAVATLKVPSSFTSTATDFLGQPLAAGTSTWGFIYDPGGSSDNSYKLGAGGTQSILLHGQASANASGGTTTIKANVLAEVDLDLLFPKYEDTAQVTRTLTVVG